MEIEGRPKYSPAICPEAASAVHLKCQSLPPRDPREHVLQPASPLSINCSESERMPTNLLTLSMLISLYMYKHYLIYELESAMLKKKIYFCQNVNAAFLVV